MRFDTILSFFLAPTGLAVVSAIDNPKIVEHQVRSADGTNDSFFFNSKHSFRQPPDASNTELEADWLEFFTNTTSNNSPKCTYQNPDLNLADATAPTVVDCQYLSNYL
jgi:hypothetical protein